MPTFFRADGRQRATRTQAALVLAVVLAVVLHIRHRHATQARCLATRPSRLSTHHVAVVQSDEPQQSQRLLFFSASKDACRSPMDLPSRWQSRAVVTCDAHCTIAHEWFPDDYIGLLVVVLALLPERVHAKPRVLILGNGAGVLSTLFWRIMPDARIDAVEADDTVIHLGERFFGSAATCATPSVRNTSVPSGLGESAVAMEPAALQQSRACVHHADARHFVQRRGRRRHEARYDLIALDAFAWFSEQDEANDPYRSDAAVPDSMADRRWCAALHRLLRPETGVLAANLWSEDETTAKVRRRCDENFGGGARLVLEAGPAQTVEAWAAGAAAAEAMGSRDGLARAVGRLPNAAPAVAGRMCALAKRSWRQRVLL